MSSYNVISHGLAFMMTCFIYSGFTSGKMCTYLYVIPSWNESCSMTPCITFSQIATNSTHYLTSNTTLIFLHGVHRLEHSFYVTNVSQFSMQSLRDNSTSSHISVRCMKNLDSPIMFAYVSHVLISGLKFIDCGGNKIESVKEFVLLDTLFQYQKDAASALEVVNTTLKIESCSFLAIIQLNNSSHTENTGRTIAGGAIVTSHTNVTINGSLFQGNSANRGGAISFVKSSDVIIDNCDFIQNTAAGNCGLSDCIGGALFVSDHSSITVLRSSFVHNHASNSGGVMALLSSKGTIRACYFSNNSAHDNGGVFKIESSTLIIDHIVSVRNISAAVIAVYDSTFSNNTADIGGAIWANNSNLRLKSTVFAANSAIKYGGSMCSVHSYIVVSNSYLTHNKANGFGGAFVAYDSTVIMDQTIFTNNSATTPGGIVFLVKCITIINNSIFSNNIAHKALSTVTVNVYYSFGPIFLDSNGGVVFVLNSILLFDNCTFYGNKVSRRGGVIFAKDASKIITDSCTFMNNSADTNGGVLFAQDIEGIAINNSTFIINTASINGGVFYVVGIKITIKNSFFKFNAATDSGGVISAFRRSEVLIVNSTFKQNTAGQFGGILTSTTSKVTIEISLFSYNTGGTLGGVVDTINESSITVMNSTFTNNRAAKGGIISASGVWVNISGCLFSINSASTYGGIMYIVNSTVLIDDSSFSRNEARQLGGVICTHTNSSVVIDDSIFINNTALNAGGVIFAQDTHKTFSITNGFFSNNTASRDGGGTFYTDNAEVFITNKCTFTHNTASGGGAVFFTKHAKLLTVKDCSFNHNSLSSGRGVVVFAEDIECITVKDSRFSNNTAEDDGGVFHLYKVNLLVYSCYFYYNTAPDRGGVINTFELSYITLANSTFIGNTAGTYGGAISTARSNTHLNNCTFHMNSAGVMGGVVNAVNTSVTIENGNFTNSSSRYGGTLHLKNSFVDVHTSVFRFNRADINGGAIFSSQSSMYVKKCTFLTNSASFLGGAINAVESSNVVILVSTFKSNTASYAGVIDVKDGVTITIANSVFHDNVAEFYGGVIRATVLESHFITINNSVFSNNSAENAGIALLVNADISIFQCNFSNNVAHSALGGVLLSHSYNNVTLHSTIFSRNSAHLSGGVLNMFYNGSINIYNCTFHFNEAPHGGVIYVQYNISVYINHSTFKYNRADNGGVLAAHDSANIAVCYCILSQNSAMFGGVLDISHEAIVRVDNSMIENNTAEIAGGGIYLQLGTWMAIDNSTIRSNTATSQGGGLYMLGGNLTVLNSILSSNAVKIQEKKETALNKIHTTDDQYCDASMSKDEHSGGALYSEESRVNICGQTVITNNTANVGTGLYIQKCKLYFHGYTILAGNRAITKGGGIHAVNSSILMEGKVHFINNEAERGGGISIEGSTEFYPSQRNNFNTVLKFTANIADYGGALYVNDDTITRTCYQMIRNSDNQSDGHCFINTNQVVHFNHNQARIVGSNLYGGLLDRCIPSHSTDYGTSQNGIMYLFSSSNMNAISSDPVRVCFCIHGQHDCSYNKSSIYVKKTESFDLDLVAVDQVNHTLNAIVYSYLTLNNSETLGEHRSHKVNNKGCNRLTFDLIPSQVSQKLILYSDGPCTDKGISQRAVEIHILPCTCPIGFQVHESKARCDCNCDPHLDSFIEQCNISTESVTRQGNFWITYIETASLNTSGYLIYANCPLDYCQPSDLPINVNLNLANGSDIQCAQNRSGLLCGTCQVGLSLSLGSSLCLHCNHNYWKIAAILIGATVAGIALVATLLILNLTVAIGTLNAVIFYANIVAANGNVYFSTPHAKIASVFISLLNLDIGFDTCFYEGMDTYAKTWLQLAFPTYIIFLVLLVIKISSCSTHFSNLIARKNPVATLATLILLSYTKLLRIIIFIFSSGTLEYPSGYSVKVWLPDATVGYNEGKHIALFALGVIILLVGLAYIIIVLCWQWFHRCLQARVFTNLRSLKLSIFLETYNGPYTLKHRYWTGLLLLVRVCIYLVLSFNVSGDPRVTLLSTCFIMSCLILYKDVFRIKIYRTKSLNIIETLMYFNLVTFSAFTWFNFDKGSTKLQEFAVFCSVGAVFVTLFIMFGYHIYQFCGIKAHFKKIFKKEDTGYHTLLNDYQIDQPQQAEPTYSVVEIPKQSSPPRVVDNVMVGKQLPQQTTPDKKVVETELNLIASTKDSEATTIIDQSSEKDELILVYRQR